MPSEKPHDPEPPRERAARVLKGDIHWDDAVDLARDVIELSDALATRCRHNLSRAEEAESRVRALESIVNDRQERGNEMLARAEKAEAALAEARKQWDRETAFRIDENQRLRETVEQALRQVGVLLSMMTGTSAEDEPHFKEASAFNHEALRELGLWKEPGE